jgi:hypothetical protein
MKKEGRRKKEEGRRKKEEGRRKREEGRGKREEGRREKEEGQTKNEENIIIFLSSNSQSVLKSLSFISFFLRVLSVFAVR